MSEQQRLEQVFNNFYYNGFSVTNQKEAMDSDTLTSLFNEYLLMYQLVMTMMEHKLTDIHKLKILDIGCGNGRMLRKLCDIGAGPQNCFGIDISEKAIEYATNNSPSGINFIQGDFANPIYKEQFDLITCLGVLIHIKDNEYIRKIAKEVGRILKPGGLFIVTATGEETKWNTEMQKITRNFEHDELTGLFSELEHVTTIELYFDKYPPNVSRGFIIQALDYGISKATYKMIVFRAKEGV